VIESRKHLSAKGLLTLVREKFTKINSPRALARRSAKPIDLVDCLMSGLAVFSMKFPSLLQFEEQSNNGGMIKRNLRMLYQIDQIPSDTYLRERLDEIDPREVRKVFKTVFAGVQRGKALEAYTYLDGHYLMPMDMTGFFSSSKVHCQNCCIKKHNKPNIILLEEVPKDIRRFQKDTYLLCGNLYMPWELIYIDENNEMVPINMALLPDLSSHLIGRARRHLSASHIEIIKGIISVYHESRFASNVTYYHNMMCAAIVHPDIKVVLPFAPEPVLKTDGATKNDCEQNAAKRLIADIRREHPHLKLIAVQDAIGANYPNLLELKFADIRFIVGVKPDNHKDLFNLVNNTECQEYQHETSDGKIHRYRYMNDVPLNRTGFEINFLEYWETDKKGIIKHFSWVTDIHITNENVYQLMRGGRANWQIENNTFNTLKNQGYHFSHNFGHGYQHLCTVFGMLMMLAFFIDQVQERCCELFKKARKKFRTRIGLWYKMKSLFLSYAVASWENLFNVIADGYQEIELIPNTS
jgi:hypothetical protein